jgi:hypothetical protein
MLTIIFFKNVYSAQKHKNMCAQDGILHDYGPPAKI